MLLSSVVKDSGGRQELRQKGRALLKRENNGWHLRYTAADESGQRSAGDIRLQGTAVAVRSITGGYTLELEPGRTTALRLSAEGCAAALDIKTRRAFWDLESESQGRIELDYVMLAAGETVSEISLRMQLKKNKESKP